MKTAEFSQIKQEFEKGDVAKKIKLYVESEGLTQEQYRDLLKMFPLEELSKLEEALE